MWQVLHTATKTMINYVPAFMQGHEYPFVALTPHPVNICAADGTPLLILAPSGVSPRVDQVMIDTACPAPAGAQVFAQTAGQVVNMPAPRLGVTYIVGIFLLNHPDIAGRDDVIAVDSQRGAFRQWGEFWVSRFLTNPDSSDEYKARRDARKNRHEENMEKLASIVNPNPANASNNWGMGMNTGHYEPIDLFEYLSQEVFPEPTQPEPVRGIISPIPVIEGTVIKATCIKPEQFPSPEWRALIRLDSGELVVGDTSAKMVNEGERVYYAGYSFRPNRWGKDLIVSCLKEAREVADQVAKNEDEWKQACKRWSEAFAMERATRWNKSSSGDDDAYWGPHSDV